MRTMRQRETDRTDVPQVRVSEQREGRPPMTFEENVDEIRRMWAIAIKGDNFYIKTGQGQTGEVPPKLGFAFHAERDRFVQEALDAIVAEHDEYNKLRQHIDTAPAHRFCPVRSG